MILTNFPNEKKNNAIKMKESDMWRRKKEQMELIYSIAPTTTTRFCENAENLFLSQNQCLNL